MKTVVTIEEIKERYKNANEVKSCVSEKTTIIKSLKNISCGITNSKEFFYEKENGGFICLYNPDTNKFAEIISYKSTKEKTPKKELKALLKLAKECLEKPNSEVCQTYKDKILDACPSLKKEEELIVGQWYKTGIGRILCYQGKDKYHYGFNAENEWSNIIGNFSISIRNYEKADPKKVKELLIAECEKQGIKDGNYECLELPNHTHKNCKEYVYYEKDNQLFVRNDLGCQNLIFDNGKFAKVIETISLSEAERRLNLKIKID